MKKVLASAENIAFSDAIHTTIPKPKNGDVESFLPVVEFFLKDKLIPFSGDCIPVLRFVGMGILPNEVPILASLYARYHSKEFSLEGYDSSFSMSSTCTKHAFSPFFDMAKRLNISLDLENGNLQKNDLIEAPVDRAHITLIRRFKFYGGGFDTYLNLLKEAAMTSDNVLTTFYKDDLVSFFNILSSRVDFENYDGGVSVINFLNFAFRQHNLDMSTKAIRYSSYQVSRGFFDDTLALQIVSGQDVAAEDVVVETGGEGSLEDLLLDDGLKRQLQPVVRREASEVPVRQESAWRRYGCFRRSHTVYPIEE